VCIRRSERDQTGGGTHAFRRRFWERYIRLRARSRVCVCVLTSAAKTAVFTLPPPLVLLHPLQPTRRHSRTHSLYLPRFPIVRVFLRRQVYVRLIKIEKGKKSAALSSCTALRNAF